MGKRKIYEALLCAVAVCILIILYIVVGKMDLTSYVKTNIQNEDEDIDISGNQISGLSLGVGINIGNSLESKSKHGLENTLDYETYWGNPLISQELIDLISAEGFSMVRVPVTWDQHFLDDEYTIDPVWLQRVKEVINYAYEDNLYVIINAHHDQWISTDINKISETEKITKIVWKQIAEYFSDYDDHLLFESFNEPCYSPDSEWAYRDESSYEVLNVLNEAFVETVRNTGGQNAARWLLLPTYYNSCVEADLDAFECLTDEKLILSVHLYSPFDFTGGDDLENNYWSSKDSASVHTLSDNIDNIIEFKKKNKMQVVVTEMGAKDKNNIESRMRWTRYVVSKLHNARIPYVWWDDTYYEGEIGSYSLLDRANNSIVWPELVKTIVDGEK